MPPVGLKHSTVAVDFLLRFIQLDSLVLAKRHNARHQPPRRTAELKQVSRMRATLFAVGCMPLFGGACDVNRLLREHRPHLFYDLTRSRIPKAIRVNDLSIINIDAELAKSASYYFYLRVRFFPQLGCHTGSHHLLDGSNRAVMYGDFLHGFTLLFGNEPTTPYNRSERMA